MTDAVLETFPLGFQWPTLDPFLFCVHHDDAYPAGNDDLGPDASLDGRDLGNDFEPRDGWRMYHGVRVPGFPSHPHRGFETVTFARQGLIDHSDSLGATARFGRGDVQWLTAGGGIVHAEMFPLVHPDRPNPTELFQIWLNLPAEDKLVDAHFSMLWSDDVPRVEVAPGVEVTVIAGAVAGHVPPSPPPRSWASRPDTEVAIWNVRIDPGGHWDAPAAAGDAINRVLYVYAGSGLTIDGDDVAARTGVVLRAGQAVTLATGGAEVEALLLQGRPIGEPVAQHGPFVMNQRVEIEQAIRDYQRTGYGGWPWPSSGPHHGRDAGRFARHADGHVEHR